MVSLNGPRSRASAILAGTMLLWSCAPDSAGIRRLPLEPGVALAEVSISPGTTSLGFIGDAATLTAAVRDTDGANAAQGLSFSWRSLEPEVATVDRTGTVTAVTEGSARIEVRVFNLVDTANVTVKRVPAEISLNVESLLFTELGVTSSLTATVVDGGGQSLSSDEVAWSSADTAVAKVDASGVVTTVGQGSTTVKGTAGAVQASVSVRVATGPSELSVDPPTLSFDALGDTARLAGTVLDAAGAEISSVIVTFLWGDTLIADVDSVGLVTATGVGTTTVTVIGDTVRSVIPVSVTQAAQSVAVTPAAQTLTPGGMWTFSATAADRNGNAIPNPNFTWSSSDPAIATVNGSTATAVAEGTVSIVATLDNVADTATLTVIDPPVDSIDVTPDTLNLNDGETVQLSARFFDATGMELIGPTASWSSSDPSVASVTSSGFVTGVDPGSTWIVGSRDAGIDSTYVEVVAVSLMDIEVRFAGTTPSATVIAAFDAAEVRWEELIVGDLASGSVNVSANACGTTHPAVAETVDDLLIYAEVTAIDGSGGVLGQAGPCLTRSASGHAILGVMQFDEDDLADLAASGDLTNVVIHEMGHVLGLGSGTNWTNVLVDAGTSDPYWPGVEAVARFDLLGGLATNKVPVANTGGSGTADAHWREAVMGRELMTGFLNSGVANPLSAITVGAMDDMGYQVDITKADAYTVSSSLRQSPDRIIELREIPRPAPMVVDRQGRIISGGGR